MSEQPRTPAVRVSVDTIGQVVEKRAQYAALFDLPLNRVQVSIKGRLTSFEDSKWGGAIEVPTFRAVEQLGQIGGVANRRAKLAKTGWVAVKFSDGPIDLLLTEEVL